MNGSGQGAELTDLENDLILSAIHGNDAAREVLLAADRRNRPVTLSDAALIDLYWHTTGDDWAIPEDVMVRYGRAVIKAVQESAK